MSEQKPSNQKPSNQKPEVKVIAKSKKWQDDPFSRAVFMLAAFFVGLPASLFVIFLIASGVGRLMGGDSYAEREAEKEALEQEIALSNLKDEYYFELSMSELDGKSGDILDEDYSAYSIELNRLEFNCTESRTQLARLTLNTVEQIHETDSSISHLSVLKSVANIADSQPLSLCEPAFEEVAKVLPYPL